MEEKMKPMTLYLAGWQIRMIKDYVGDKELKAITPKLTKMMVKIIDKKTWVMYRQPIWEAVKAGAWNLYLTDEQINYVSEAMGAPIGVSALLISPKMMEEGNIIFG